MSKSRGHQRHEEHEEHEEHVNHEAWVIPYADMLTLLMALFLVLFAVGRTDIEKFKKLAESFREEFGNGGSAEIVSVGTGSTGDTPIEGGNGVLDNVEIRPTAAEITQAIEVAEKTAAEVAVGELDEVREEIQVLADQQGVGDKIAFRFEGRGLVLTILDDSVLFEGGQATLQPAGISILELVTGSLAPAAQRHRDRGSHRLAPDLDVAVSVQLGAVHVSRHVRAPLHAVAGIRSGARLGRRLRRHPSCGRQRHPRRSGDEPPCRDRDRVGHPAWTRGGNRRMTWHRGH